MRPPFHPDLKIPRKTTAALEPPSLGVRKECEI